MKEFTIEEKAKRYDEALERAKENKPLEEIFPELAESDDDRIKESIIDFLVCITSLKDGKTLSNEDFDTKVILEWVAWLEKKGEQKPVEMVNDEDSGIDGLYAAIDILQNTLGKVEGYQSDDGILEHKAAITAVKKLYEQKPTKWSEEDKKMIKDIIKLLDELGGDRNAGYYTLYELNCREKADWLKSLKERVLSPHWKPSEKQMEALKIASDKDWDIDGNSSLYTLYNDLKKL